MSSIDIKEIEKFSEMADQWWDENGKFKPLHKFNPTRVSYIKTVIAQHFTKKEINEFLPFKGISFLDVGCGGGLLAEPIAKLGGDVTAIDASEKNIKIASTHAEKENIEINYINTTVEELIKSKKRFDVVLNMEVVEHVSDVQQFMADCCKLVKKDGLIFNATLNRTKKSYLFAIIGAEYVMRWLPKGTHEWKRFLKPSELLEMLEKNNCNFLESTGIKYIPFKDKFFLSKDLSVNYIVVGKKS